MKKNLLFTAFLGATLIANSQTLVTTDNLASERTKHQAVLLNSGNVLCFGGNNGWAMSLVYYTSAEIYNTGTNTWSNTGSMSEARDNFASAVLPNGNVLAIGGKNSVTSGLATCEIFNVGTNTWSAGPSMTYGRWGHNAVTLQNGKVLVAGGDDDYGQSAELYDPVANTWTLTPDMQYEHGQYSSLVLLADGKVLCTGGWFASPDGTVAEVYDPVLNTWTAVGDMGQNRTLKHTSVLLNDGKVLIFGGTSSGSAEIFDPNTGTFTATASPLTGRSHAQGFRMTDGKVFTFATGGFSIPTNCMEIYNPTTGTWSSTTSSIYGAAAGAAVVLNTGQIFIIGGNFTTGNGASDVCYLVNGVTAGIENNTVVSNTALSIYPNPASDMITIELEEADFSRLSSVEIVDVTGRIVLANSTIANNKISIDVSKYETGLYYCRLIFNDGEVAAEQFVVN